MKLKKLLTRRVETWLPLAKGAGRALALTEGLLVALAFAAMFNLLNVSPIHAQGNITSLSLSSDTISMDKPNGGGLVTGSHTVTVDTQLPASYSLTMSSIDTNTDMCQDGKDTDCIEHTDTTIDSPDALSAGRWGFALPNVNSLVSDKFSPLEDYTNNLATAKFAAVPDIDNPVTIRDVDRGMWNDLETTVVYGVNVGNDQSAGSYSSTVRYTATAKLPPATFGPSTDDYGTDGKVQVDYDEHMIPVKYTGNEDKAQWTSLTYQEIADNPKDWYNYPEKQWANAVTVKADKLADYQNKSAIVKEEDVLGYWVYIPRYEYKVRSISGSNIQSAANFDIRFQTSGQKTPLNNGEVKVDTYATHPAFTWGNEELNGIWVGKFETTGSTTNPTILPNNKHIANSISSNFGLSEFYDIAKSVGKYDPNAGGGSTAVGDNTHNLVGATTHILKNSEWGAAVYLSASKYGAGVIDEVNSKSTVKINGSYRTDADGNGNASIGTTGCGPATVDSLSVYDGCNAYHTSIGQTASTTHNTYGIYDMSGGAWENVMAGLSAMDNDEQTITGSHISFPVSKPYVDIYPYSTFNGDYTTNLAKCSYSTCGGHALYETSTWNAGFRHFVNLDYPWFERGGAMYSISGAGIFVFDQSYDVNEGANGFRVALIAQ